MTTTATVLRHKLIDQTNALYRAVPGGVFDNPKAPDWVNAQYVMATGDDPDRLGDRVVKWAESKGFTVTAGKLDDPDANAVTNFTTKTVTYLPDLTPAARAEALLHEAGHIASDHANPDNLVQTMFLGKGWAEIEAETIAYIVGGLHGMDLGCMAVPYIAGWGEGEMAIVKEFSRQAEQTARKLSTELDEIQL